MKNFKNYILLLESFDISSIVEDCEPFIKQLKMCEPGTFLYRGIERPPTKDISIKIGKENRYPRDTPRWAHERWNELFKDEFGWEVRNGVFCYMYICLDDSETLIMDDSGKTNTVKQNIIKNFDTAYGQESFIVFPIGEFEMIVNTNIVDLFSEFEGRFEWDEWCVESDYDDLYGENRKGEWIYNGIKTGCVDKDDAEDYILSNPDKFDLHERTDSNKDDKKYLINYEYMVWEPEVSYGDYLNEEEENYKDELDDDFRKTIREYESLTMKELSDRLKHVKLNIYKVEISIKTKKYYLIRQKLAKNLIAAIWGDPNQLKLF